MLIWAQDSSVEYVASKTTFNKLGFKVNKDDNDGLKIFIPNFYTVVKIIDENEKVSYKPYFYLTEVEKEAYKDKNNDSVIFYKQKLSGFSLGNVFSAKDTDMPLEAINKELSPIFEDKQAEQMITPLIKTIYKDGFKVEFEDLTGTVKGYCDHNENKIVVKKGIGSLMQMKVLIHEYAHALAHKHLKNNNKEYQEHRNKYETEAESIAYIVSKYLGMKTTDYSLSYLYSYSKEKDFQEIDDSFSTIINYSKKIINNFNKFYNLDLFNNYTSIEI